MTHLNDLARQPTHTCHVCATDFDTQLRDLMRYPQPPCCPACDAPLRISNVPIGQGAAGELLVLLAGGPVDRGHRSNFGAPPVLRILYHVRTEQDVDAVIEEARRAGSLLRGRASSSSTAPSRDPLKAALWAATVHLREQADSGLLDWRLTDLREQALQLLRAEREHHLHVYGCRRAESQVRNN